MVFKYILYININKLLNRKNSSSSSSNKKGSNVNYKKVIILDPYNNRKKIAELAKGKKVSMFLKY